MEVRVFVDTNVLLHYRRLEEVEWGDVVERSDVTVVIPYIVVRELDRQKFEHQSGKIRRRAAAVVRDLEERIGDGMAGQLREGVRVTVQPSAPQIEFEQRGLQVNTADDWLIGSILVDKEQHREDEAVLVSGDFGLRLKARGQGIRAVQMPDALRLPEEASEEQRRIRKLEAELREVRDRTPRLTLAFNYNEDGHAALSMPSSPAWTAERIGDEVEKERSRVEPNPFAASMLANLAGVRAEALQRYLAKYEAYLKSVAAQDEFLTRSLLVELRLMNVGTAPAEDIHAILGLPEGIACCGEDDVPKALERPKAPETGIMASLSADPLQFNAGALGQDLFQAATQPNAAGPRIIANNPAQVEYHVRQVKHQFGQPLDPLYVTFPGRDAVRSFCVTYRLLAASLPREVTGELHVRVEEEPGAGEEPSSQGSDWER